MDMNRKTAYYTLMDVETKKAYSNIVLNHHIICRKPSSPAFVRELVYGVLENKMLLDHVIDKLADQGIEKIKTSDLIILRMGIYQLAKMDSVPEYAAVNESVNLAKRFARGRDKFINGVLRSYIRDRYSIKLPDRSEDEIRYLSIKYSYEPWIIELWRETYENMDFVEELLKAGNETADLTIRINWLRVMKTDLIRDLERRGFQVREGKHSRNALYVRGENLLETEFYRNGMFSVQDEASQMVAQMTDPEHGDIVMDVCAAPGGKSLAIAERMNNNGIVMASDIYKRKLDIVEREAGRLGINIIQTKTWDATKVDSSMIGRADKVLVDAPCSGLGVIRRKPEIKYKKKTKEILGLPIKQMAILSASASYVKPGGRLIYCTCTVNPYENERIVSDFMRKDPAFSVENTVQLLPNIDGTDGFYICKMKKSDDLVEK